jgi:hypothetical protein
VPQVIAVKLDQVEGVKEDAPSRRPQSVEFRQAIIVASYGFAIDEAGARLERERGARDRWEAAGQEN